MTARDRDALVLIGSNVEPERQVPRAFEHLRRRHEVVATSACYRTPAVGGAAGQPDFVNAAVRIRTDLPPRALREACRRVEESCGRRRTEDRYAPRTMDLDVMLLGDLVLDLDGWRLPAPLLQREAFALVPSAEAWPDAVHPVLRKTLAVLRAELPAARCADLSVWEVPLEVPARTDRPPRRE